MKIMEMNMKNITEYPTLKLDAFWIARLMPGYWNNYILSGNFWRLYRNSSAGAGLWVDGKKVAIEPDKFYVIPPECGLRTWCEQETDQFYVHFEAVHLRGGEHFRYRCIELEEGDLALADEIMAEMREKGASGQVLALKIIALVSKAMTKLQEGDLLTVPGDRLMDEICARLKSAPGSEWSVSDLAAKAGMSTNLFLRKFKEITGTSPYKYVLSLRYAQAAQLLAHSVVSIDQICERCGFHDRFHFSREFKKIYGVPPGTYREMHRR